MKQRGKRGGVVGGEMGVVSCFCWGPFWVFSVSLPQEFFEKRLETIDGIEGGKKKVWYRNWF